MSSEGTLDRTAIVNQISQVHLQPSQNLRQFSLPGAVYDLARNFVSSRTAIEKYGKKHCRYYAVLNCIEGGGIYALLEQAAEHSTLEQDCDVIAQWQVALKALLRYALNLLLAPNMLELRTVKLYNSFFVYQIANKLEGAEKILLALGYSRCHLSSSTNTLSLKSQELVYNGEVDNDHVAETATDLVILLCDLEQLQTHMLDRNSPDLHQSPVQEDTLAGILKKWSFDSQNVLSNDAVLFASISHGNSEVVHDLRVSSQLPPNVQGTNYHHRNLDYVQTQGEYLARDPVPSQSRDFEHTSTNMQSSPEACQYSPKHKSHWETSANIWTQAPSPVDDYLQHPVNYSDSNLITENSTPADSISSSDFLSSSFLQGIPRPNIEDLPEPIYNNEEEFTLEKGRLVGNSFNNNQLGFAVNQKPDQDNNLIETDFSLDEHVSTYCQERTGSIAEEVPIFETYSHRAAEELNTGTRSNQSFPSHCGSLKRTQSYDLSKLADHQSLAFNCENSPPAAKAVHRSDGDLIKSYDKLSIGYIQGSIDMDTVSRLNQQVYQSNNQLPNVETEQGTPRPETMSTKDKTSIKKTVLCETEHTEDGFVVLDLCSNSHRKCSAIRTSGAMHSDDKALEGLEWMTGNTTRASMWTCHYCTNINAMELLKCDICGVKHSN